MLIEHGYEVTVLVRCGYDHAGEVKVVVGDLGDIASLERLLDGADLLFHCAAELHDESCMSDTNFHAVQRLVEIATENAIKTFVHISSAGVIGSTDVDWVDEDSACNPTSRYEYTKWQAEQHLNRLVDGPMRVCMLRPTNVVDKAQPGVVNMAMRNSWHDRLSLWIKGRECAHLVHARDVAAAALFVAGHAKCSGAYFVGDDEDDLNTVAGVYAYARNLRLDHFGALTLPYALPLFVPNLIRKLRQGVSLHGRTRFSSGRLRSAGFAPPLGLRGAIDDIVGGTTS
jgi:nucleoside-diphosphate-sugar epimerase